MNICFQVHVSLMTGSCATGTISNVSYTLANGEEFIYQNGETIVESLDQ